MTYILLYVIAGLALGWMFRTEGDRPAILSGLEYVALFALIWPIVLLFTIQRMMKDGFKWRVGNKTGRVKGSREE